MKFCHQATRLACAAVVAAGLMTVTTAGNAQEAVALTQPVLITSLGQSLEGFQIHLVSRRAGIENQYDPLARPEMLEGNNALFVAVAASLKGFGEAGIKIEDEILRGTELFATAKEAGATVVVFHIGGEEHRDELTDQLLTLFVPQADLLVINHESDFDGMISGLAEPNGIPIYEVEGLPSIVPVLKELFPAA